jgi:hypothetical protein
MYLTAQQPTIRVHAGNCHQDRSGHANAYAAITRRDGEHRAMTDATMAVNRGLAPFSIPVRSHAVRRMETWSAGRPAKARQAKHAPRVNAICVFGLTEREIVSRNQLKSEQR